MKINLKKDIFIMGFDEPVMIDIIPDEVVYLNQILYSGEVDEITDEFAEEIVMNFGANGLYQNYLMESQYEEYMFDDPIDSLRSSCKEKYCIIWKEI